MRPTCTGNASRAFDRSVVVSRFRHFQGESDQQHTIAPLPIIFFSCRAKKLSFTIPSVMARPKKPDNQRLVLQALRISPIAKQRLTRLKPDERRKVIAEMRVAAERVIIAMTDSTLQAAT